MGKKLLAASLVGILMLFALTQPQQSAQAVCLGWERATAHLLPSLFPVSVLCLFLYYSKLAPLWHRLLQAPAKAVTGVEGPLVAPLSFGLLCGFPTGAIVLKQQYDQGAISCEQFACGNLFCHNAGLGFLFSYLPSQLGPRGALCVALGQLCALGILARIARRLYPLQAPATPYRPKTLPWARAFSQALRQGTVSLAMAGAAVIFFSFVSSCAGFYLKDLLPPGMLAVFLGSLELTGACQLAGARVGLCALAVGWGGLCVGAQVSAACHPHSLPKETLYFRLAQAALCFAFSQVFSQIIL